MMNLDWSILGIDATRDKKAITAAYRSRLLQVNPEDKPEEFKQLRAAYEEALRLADAADEPAPAADTPDTPLSRWQAELRALYADFPRRLQPQAWAELLNADVCIALDSRPQAEEALLRFLMDDFYIPQAVWQLLDATFDWQERREELYERYPKDFIDFAVMNGINMPPVLAFELFTPGLDGAAADKYRHLYHQACHQPAEELAPLLQQLDALPESHPYGEALHCRLLIETGQEEAGRAGYRELAARYPEDNTLQISHAQQCAAQENWSEAEEITRRVLERKPDHWQAKRLLADCLAATEREEDGKDILFDLMRAGGGDQKLLYELGEVVRKYNTTLTARREAQYKADPQDHDNTLKLAWCYLQNEAPDAAWRICEQLDIADYDPYDYHNLLAKTAYSREDYPRALQHLQELENIIRGLTPDGTEETARRIRRLPEMVQLSGSCLMLQEKKAEALAKFEEAVRIAPNNGEMLTKLATLHQTLGNHGQAVEVLEKLIRLMPHSYHGYYLLSVNLFEMSRDRDAFEAINRALDLETADLLVYVQKMRILLRNGVWEEVREILRFLDENQVGDATSVLWCKAQLLEGADGKKEEALQLYQTIASRLEAKEDYLPWAARVYFRITVLMADKLDAREADARQQMLEILEKGLSHDKDDPDCLDYKAWLLKREGQLAESLAIYQQLEKLPQHPLSVEREIAEIYYQDLNNHADKALHYFQILLEHGEAPDLHFYIATCYRFMGEYEKSKQHYLREKELDADDIDAYNGLGIVYEALGKPLAALENALAAIKIRVKSEGNPTRYYLRAVQILRRLRQPQQAIAMIDELLQHWDYDRARQLKFDIYCQFGMWKEADMHVYLWRDGGWNRNGWLPARIRLDILTGNYRIAKAKLRTIGKTMPPEDQEELELLLAAIDGDYDYQLQVWQRRAKEYHEQQREDTHVLMNIALLQRWSGDNINAHRTAELCYKKLDKLLTSNLKYDALYRSRLCVVLALLGRYSEARTVLAAVKQMPLCETCAYSGCKDADLFEAYIEELQGNYEPALALLQQAAEKWPDEAEITAAIRRIKKTVKANK
ncbi:MAG: tetratricopeptide repeat protein [Firmicutes bacterium]|nr:tetratricopeptide repeat protein [Bacillota bacterium]